VSQSRRYGARSDFFVETSAGGRNELPATRYVSQESGDHVGLIVLRPVRGVWHDMKRWIGAESGDLVRQGRGQVSI
jgi:hypothetical protein